MQEYHKCCRADARFTSSDFNVSSLTFCPTKWLVNEHRRVRKAEALALLTSSQKYRTHTHRHTYTNCRNIRLNPLHSIVDSQASINHSTRRIDIQINILGCILTLEEKQLCYSEVGNIIIDWRANEDDAFLEQARIDVHPTLTTRRRLDNIRNNYPLWLHYFTCVFDPFWIVWVKNATHLYSFLISETICLSSLHTWMSLTIDRDEMCRGSLLSQGHVTL